MPVTLEPTDIPDLVIARVTAYPDARGSFRELFRADHFAASGLPSQFAQMNHSRSALGVVRGLHFQFEPPMAKLMRVAKGRAFLVAVDIRRGSKTCGRAWWRETRADEDLWVFAPAGFARGLQALEDGTEVEYLCTATYSGAGEAGIRFDDPALGIPWPLTATEVSPKDRAAPTLAEWLAGPQGGVFAV
ncbi:MAG: dTDP-4-dehydrorhamnose 3,5-epimerase [Gemmatimonadaceae bacterium]|nr:dTDP-4-dehydrorhamnose 3,5-epimerase [Gemmatimonadaceae bacterium]